MKIDRTCLSALAEEPGGSPCGACCFRTAAKEGSSAAAGYDASSCQFVAEACGLSASGGSREIAFRLVLNAILERRGGDPAEVLALDDAEAIRRCDG